MQFLIEKIKQNLNESLVLITISNPRNAQEYKKYTVRPVLMRNQLLFQLAGYSKTQVQHENLDEGNLLRRMEELLPLYKQFLMKTLTEETTALINKQGKAAIKLRPKQFPAGKSSLEAGTAQDSRKAGAAQSGMQSGATQKSRKAGAAQGIMAADLARLSHNRKKKYILTEGMKIPFLVDLGVMTKEGKIVQKKYDKFRQINRFLEFIRDVADYLPQNREITILDFGCGKSYLTFAVYYYLHELEGLDVRIIGLDLKADVIADCAKLARKYHYDRLNFLEGAIEDYEGVDHVDMVVTLHACDTATDYALYKAINWGAKVILSVPCCQHELNGQIKTKNDLEFDPIVDYGILKERFAAMATDGIRAKLLEACGFDTQILEFIDMEHTPKNLLIRGIRVKRRKEEKYEEINKFCDQFGFKPTLLSLLQEERASKNE